MEELKKREELRRQRGGDIGRKEQSQVTRAMPAIWTDWGLFCGCEQCCKTQPGQRIGQPKGSGVLGSDRGPIGGRLGII